jgi:DNA-directed RNA polymerase, subunit E''
MLAFSPLIQEVVEGPIVQVTNIGAYVNLGPVDGFVHISQILDDQIHYDQIRGVLVGDKTKKSLQKGDVVRARIVSISSAGPGRMMRIALTMRQPYLGKLDWIAEEVKGMSK